MKKKSLLVVAIVVAMLIVVAFVGCKEKFTLDDIYSLASYSSSSGETSRNLSILVKQGETVVYNYKDGQVVESVEGITFDPASFGNVGKGLEFKSSYFTNEQLMLEKDMTASYSAEIADAANFLGLADITNPKVAVKANASENKLLSLELTYDTAKNGYDFSVAISVEMVY